MTRRRFIADEFSHDRAVLAGDHAEHLSRVLRSSVGQEFDISAGLTVRRGVITAVQSDRIDFELHEEIPGAVAHEITLLLAIYKFDRMEWAIEKCTELGVARIIPVISRRTDSHLASASAKRVERWERIARQASEQSRRVAPPDISQPQKLSEALRTLEGLRIVLAESEGETQLRDLLLHAAASNAITLAIGPEGGWTEDEIKSFHQHGWKSASLGPTILRAETAAIAGCAIVVSALS